MERGWGSSFGCRRKHHNTANLVQVTFYFVHATLGTPPQTFRFLVDTGSSDLLVNTGSSPLCSGARRLCDHAGTYNSNASSTYDYVGSYFNISYVDGSSAAGDYATDTLTIGGTRVENLQFGIGYDSSLSQGVMGIGYTANEVQVRRAELNPYDNVPAKMAAAGIINSNAYSLWLNSLDADRGSVLFGGIDTERFQGTLATLPVQQTSPGSFTGFFITLTGLSHGDKPVVSDQALAVLLDSGSTLTYLPDEWVMRIYAAVSATFDPDQSAAFIPCSDGADPAVDVTFSLSGVDIRVSADHLIMDIVAPDGRRPSYADHESVCLFGIAPAGSGANVLGATFLRSAYVVFDLDNNEISLAQAAVNATSSNVLEIGTGRGAVPGAIAVANPVAAATGIPIPLFPGETDDDDDNDIGDDNNQSKAAVRAAVNSPLAAIVAFAVGAFIFNL